VTRETRMMSGIILITVPTIQYGGYFLLTSLLNKSGGDMENPLRQNFFRAGHAHAGVIVILSLICQMLAEGAALPTPVTNSHQPSTIARGFLTASRCQHRIHSENSLGN
jgi:hypothetical protein